MRFPNSPLAVLRTAFATAVFTATAASVALGSAAAQASDAAAAAEDSKAEDAVQFLVLRENGVGSAAAAQKYIDMLADAMAKVAGWSGAVGKYHSSRKLGESHIEAAKPHFGFLSYNAFLALTPKYKLATLGQAKIKGGGGSQYFVITKKHFALDGCKGVSLATNHGGDETFVNAVVFDGALSLSDFDVQKTRRPVQTIKAVINDEAECALVDDAQVASLASIDGGLELRAVWSSAEVPSVVVVAFPSAPAAEVKTFSASLPKICVGDGKKACDASGIETLSNVAADAYAADLAKYQGKAK